MRLLQQTYWCIVDLSSVAAINALAMAGTVSDGNVKELRMSDAGKFRALVLDETDGKVTGAVRSLDNSALPEGDVTVAISHSTLNYKDGLILNGLGRLVRKYPHVPGIDFAGTVIESSSDRFGPGDGVILTGWRVGETRWGGYAERARVKADWLVRIPEELSAEQAMTIGTAGFTAMLAVMALEENGLDPMGGEVLVTGANGGVGGVAVALLAGLGYEVVASTGRMGLAEGLRSLGAEKVIDRNELSEPPTRPLMSEQWAGCIDAVGGSTLASVLSRVRYGGAVAACGLAGGSDLNTTVIPFLLRGISLLGIDSVMCPVERRRVAWRRIAREVPTDAFAALTTVVGLDDLPELGKKILKGATQGRIVVDVTR